MKLTGELKNKVEKTENTEQAKKLIEEAGFELTDDVVNAVFGGVGGSPDPSRHNDAGAEFMQKLMEEKKPLEYDKRPE